MNAHRRLPRRRLLAVLASMVAASARPGSAHAQATSAPTNTRATTAQTGGLQTARATTGERRIALVIGNGDYARAPLRFAQADARLMGETLRALRFTVTERYNLARQSFHQVLDEFLAQARSEGPGTVAMAFYAGHGIQLEGLNYLLPIDRQLQNNADVREFGIPAARLVRQIGEVNPLGVNIVVLDACRSNPFNRSRSPSRGAGLAPPDSPRGVLVAYSTDPDKPALDGGGRNGRNSVYTEALAEHLHTPGVPIETVFKRVRNVVADATQGQQTPWENTSLRGEFMLVPR